MKPGSDPIKKSDSDSVMESGKDTQGIDFLQALQVGGGIIAAVAILFLILRYILHII
jgi:hypothetical protein